MKYNLKLEEIGYLGTGSNLKLINMMFFFSYENMKYDLKLENSFFILFYLFIYSNMKYNLKPEERGS